MIWSADGSMVQLLCFVLLVQWFNGSLALLCFNGSTVQLLCFVFLLFLFESRHHSPGTLGLAKGTKAVTVKLQYNDGGGGCFPLHYDNPGRPNNRVVTCLV